MHAIPQIANSTSSVLKCILRCGRSHKIPRNYSESCDCDVKYRFRFRIQAICQSVKKGFQCPLHVIQTYLPKLQLLLKPDTMH